MNRIATVIPAHNAQRFIRDTIDSVAASGTDRIIVSLDRCSDETERAVRDSGADVLITNSPVAGVCGARNHGASLAGDCAYLHFVDADDLVRPGAARILSYALEAIGQTVAAYGNIDRIGVDGRPYGAARPADAVEGHYGNVLKDMLLENLISCPSAVLVRRDAFERLGGFRVGLTHAEDWHLWARLATLGPFVHVRRIVTDYRTYPGSVSSRRDIGAAPYLKSVSALYADANVRDALPEAELKVLRARTIGGLYCFFAEQEMRQGSVARAAFWFLRGSLIAPAIARQRYETLKWIYRFERSATRGSEGQPTGISDASARRTSSVTPRACTSRPFPPSASSGRRDP